MTDMKRTLAALAALLVVPVLTGCSAEFDASAACDGYDAQRDAWASSDVEAAVDSMGSMLANAEAAAAVDSKYEPLADAMTDYIFAVERFLSSGPEEGGSAVNSAMDDIEYECIGL